MGDTNLIVAVPGTPFAGYLQPSVEGNSGNQCYLAPELQPQKYISDKIIVTKESDIYGMANIIYEARSYKLISLGPGSNLMSSP